MFSHIKNDLPSGIAVFLVALPLCLGVALASGAPLLSGVISGIIGGIVVGFLSQSHTSVSGPAAGLTTVVLAAITQLGSFDIFLLAVVLAGVIQLMGGIARTGFIADYIPSNVIKGLLAAIGIILILKQIPHAVGYDADNEGDFNFLQPDGENTFTELLKIFSFVNSGALTIAVISLIVLIGWDKTPLKKITFIPSTLIVVVLGVLLNLVFEKFFPSLFLLPTHLVQIPKIESIDALVTLPSFNQLGNSEVWIVAFTIAIVASLETLLNLEAVENIDPHKRVASPNRELIAQGVGNICAGLVGGIPVTSVIVRSSVNINSGGQTKLSTISHGSFLLISILLINPVLNLIPLSSLAAILLVTGYKLAKWSIFKEMYAKGWNQFIPFVLTILAIVFTDLLIGIIIGLAISIFFLLKANFKHSFKLNKEKLHIGETIRIELAQEVSFLNKASLKETLWSLPKDSNVIIDAAYSEYIDNDVLELIKDFKETVSVEKNIRLNIIGLQEKYELEDHIQFVNVMDKEKRLSITPQEILEILKQGNERFVKGNGTEKYFKHQINATIFNQNPMVVVVSCIDSRTSPDLIFDVSLGDLLSIRIAGNIISKEIIGSIELSCKKLGAKVIVVMGHSNCGAVASAIHSIKDGHISSITNKIEKAIAQCNCDRETITSDPSIFNGVIKNNVKNSIEEIILESDYLSQKIIAHEISITAAFYNTETGIVTFEQQYT